VEFHHWSGINTHADEVRKLVDADPSLAEFPLLALTDWNEIYLATAKDLPSGSKKLVKHG
jgi:hypothetical protein